jgi:hypothetical protein
MSLMGALGQQFAKRKRTRIAHNFHQRNSDASPKHFLLLRVFTRSVIAPHLCVILSGVSHGASMECPVSPGSP